MADKETSGLTAASALAAADLVHVVQSGNSRKATGAQLLAFAAGLLQPGYVAGRWYALMRAGPGAGLLSQNLINLSPFILPKAITISDLGCRVTTAQAANNFQLAIYASNTTTFYPTGAALAVTGDISTASATVVSADITGADVTLQPGLYWAACNQSGATSALQALGGGAGLSAPMLIGSTTIANISTGTTSACFGLTVAQAYNTWPDLTSASFSETSFATVNVGPYLLAKAA